jgi:hypothetical protein
MRWVRAHLTGQVSLGTHHNRLDAVLDPFSYTARLSDEHANRLLTLYSLGWLADDQDENTELAEASAGSLRLRSTTGGSRFTAISNPISGHRDLTQRVDAHNGAHKTKKRERHHASPAS